MRNSMLSFYCHWRENRQWIWFIDRKIYTYDYTYIVFLLTGRSTPECVGRNARGIISESSLERLCWYSIQVMSRCLILLLSLEIVQQSYLTWLSQVNRRKTLHYTPNARLQVGNTRMLSLRWGFHYSYIFIRFWT